MAPGATPSDRPPTQLSQIATTSMVSSDRVLARNGTSVKYGVANNQCASRPLLSLRPPRHHHARTQRPPALPSYEHSQSIPQRGRWLAIP